MNRLNAAALVFDFDSSPIVADEVVYIGSQDHTLYALASVTGEKLWSYTTGGAIVSSPAVANGTLYVGSLDGTVYAFTSDIVWSYTTGGRVESSPAMAGVG